MMKNHSQYSRLSFLIFLFLFCGAFGVQNAGAAVNKDVDIFRVAHAGGGYSGSSYTNSLDALNLNASRYELFELDFVFTSDGHLVCLHDWGPNQFFQEDDGKRFLKIPPTLSEFQNYVKSNQRYKNCTLDSVVSWLEKNPGKSVVTDVKDDNIKALKVIAGRYPNFSKRIIPQIYSPEEYGPVKNLGYSKIIWTLYRYTGSSATIVAKAKEMDLYAVTMPTGRARDGLGLALKKELGTKSYVHTINDQQEVNYYKSLGIDEIYTDWLFK